MSSAKERQAKRRAKIRENPELYKRYLEEDRSRKRKHRASLKETESPQELKEFQEKERKRVREYRKNLKDCKHEQDHSACATPYRFKQALGKALKRAHHSLKRAHHSLPSSPRKNLFVVGKIAKSMGLDVSDSPTSSKRSSTITEETISLVNDFYNNNDISWQAPGRKDRVIIRANKEGEKVKRVEQARYLMMSLREAHKKFMEENPGANIGLSKFCDLRPAHI